jgi:beta-lactamase superfamily II metal-dependent hydrolase
MMATPYGVLRLKVLDVGEGDAIILLLPDCERAVVVDAFDGARVLDALEEEEVHEVLLFLSHSDADHIGGVQYLLDNFQGTFVAFFYNKDRIKASLKSQYRSTLLGLAKATRETAIPFSADFNTNLNAQDEFKAIISASVSLEVLHPAHHEQSSLLGDTNEAAGVLRVVYTNPEGESWAIILAADVQLTGISCMMHRFSADSSKLRANILKFPHHGAWPMDYPGISQFAGMPHRTMAEFLDAVDPQVVILSVGFDNPHKHVRPDVYAAFQDLATKKKRLRRILCTQFTDTCLLAKGTCNPPHCAGDVEIRIGGAAHGGIEVLPQGTAHVQRILTVTDLAHAGCGHLLTQKP